MQLTDDRNFWHNGTILAWSLSFVDYLQILRVMLKNVTLAQNAYFLFLNIVSKITAKIYIQQSYAFGT